MRSPQEFRSVVRGGRTRGAGGLIVHVRERGEAGPPRLGLVVPKAVGTAVERNRLRRRIRAVWRDASVGAGPLDCVVVVRPAAASLGFPALSGHLLRCFKGTGLIAASTRGTVSE